MHHLPKILNKIITCLWYIGIFKLIKHNYPSKLKVRLLKAVHIGATVRGSDSVNQLNI